MNQEKIGAFIAACRKEHNMTQMQFAEKLGITNKAVSKWETGKCLPDATLFDDICLVLDITLNELFAGERIDPENIEKKAEENLTNLAIECQKKDYTTPICILTTILLILISISVNISVGEMWLEGTPVFSNLLFSVACLVSLTVFIRITHSKVILQKIALVFCSILLLSSIAAFVLTFWDFNQQVVFWIGFPCEVLFYGLKLFFSWGHIYVLTAVLALIGLMYSIRNLNLSNKN